MAVRVGMHAGLRAFQFGHEPTAATQLPRAVEFELAVGTLCRSLAYAYKTLAVQHALSVSICVSHAPQHSTAQDQVDSACRAELVCAACMHAVRVNLL